MDNITIRFGTPEPIYYREMDLEMGLDMDVLCRVCGSVYVTDYPEDNIDNELNDLVKNISLQSLTEFLDNVHETCTEGMFYFSEDRDDVLAKAIEEALVQKGIKSEVSIDLFTLTPECEAEINAIRKAYNENSLRTVMHMDYAYKIENEEGCVSVDFTQQH